jgi:(p)ppGpp synthase/HD superfamily hydrolase
MFQELAFQVAQKVHAGQVDKAGKDYILHLTWIQI